MKVTEIETTARSKRDLCDKLVLSLRICDSNQDVTTWLIETEEDRTEVKKDNFYKEYLYNEFITHRKILKIKSENKGI